MKRYFLCLLFCLALAGCNRNAAPERDASGVTPTGDALTIKITGTAPLCVFEYWRNGETKPTSTTVKLPYSQTFNTKSGEVFTFLTESQTESKQPIQGNVRLVVLHNGEEVASGVESPKQMRPDLPRVYTSLCAYSIP